MNKYAGMIVILAALTACTNTEQTETASEQGSSSAMSASHEHHSEPEFYYTCSMHPQIEQAEPGKCPICGMTLTKVERTPELDADEPMSSNELWQCKDRPDITSAVEKDCPIDGSPMVRQDMSSVAGQAIAKVILKKSQLSHFKPSYFPVSSMKMTKKVRLLGSVLQSEDRESTIPARIAGRVEKVFIRSTGSFVQKGDPVLNIYSPRLITAGEEYLVSRRNFEQGKHSEFAQLVEKAQERLELWGIRKLQYEAWYQRGAVPDQITIYAPSTGIVRNHNAKVGKYFKEGENFFELSDLSEVWVEMDVYEHDSAIVKLGQKVVLEFSSSPGKTVESRIDFINPVLDPKSRTLKVRTTISNPDGALKPGMIAEASLTVVFDGEPLVVPRTAVIDTGKRQVVWLKIDEQRFQAKTIHTGFESEGYVEVLEGLEAGDQVVIDGNFLLDAQAQLFGGYANMTEEKTQHHQH